MASQNGEKMGYPLNSTNETVSVMHGRSKILKSDSEDADITILFSLQEKVGALGDILSVFKRKNVSLTHIESRPSKASSGNYEFLVKIPADLRNKLDGIVAFLQDDGHVKSVQIQTQLGLVEGSVPWFPRRIRDLDEFANRVLSYGAELDADHPGFTDPVYRERRREFADIAINYKHGTPIPYVEYTTAEILTWKTIFTGLRGFYPTHACREFNYIFPLLEANCGYNEDNIPQLQDVSNFLKECTGFSLRPVAGLLSSRDFLAGLAFRVFHSTQYIRHGSEPKYTPEPDVCHELLGHVPLFADPAFADFSQEIGLASLGASDDDVEKLATDGQRKAYGAGLLSSFGELEYCLSDKPEVRDFNPQETAVQKYPITRYQPVYFCAKSFKDAKDKLKEWTSTIDRPFTPHYNPLTQTIEMLDNKRSLGRLVVNVRNELRYLEDAISKLQ